MSGHLTRAVALVLLGVVPLGADEVRLGNGDRLTGRTVSLADGTLTFATPYGDLRIPWSDVAALSTDETMLVTVIGTPPAEATLAAGEAGGRVTLHPGGAVAVTDITALARPQAGLLVDGGANTGFVTTGGNTSVNTLRLDGEIAARAGAHRYTASGAVTRAEDDGADTARNWTGALKYDRFVTPRLFVNASTILTSDRFRSLDLRTALGLGVGYQALATPRATLTGDAGLGYVDENLDAQPDDRYTAVRESVSLGVSLLPDRVQLFHQHDGYFGLTGDDNLFVTMQNGLRIGLTAGFVTTLRHDIDYDRSPAHGRRKVDRTFALTLGYRF